MDYVSERGADVVIDYTQQDYAHVLQDLEPAGLDVILETLLGDGVPETAIGLAKDGGTVVFMNNEPPDLPEIEARGIRSQFLHHRPDGAMLAELAVLYGQAILPAPPVEVLPLVAAVEAHQRSEGGHTRGKIVLAIGD
jgi:NADPH2:quinone reductase